MSKEVIQCPICREREAEECVFATVRTEDGRTTVYCCENQAKKVKNEL